MKTRNGLSSLISGSLNNFALRPASVQMSRGEARLPGDIQINVNSSFFSRQRLLGSLVPYRAPIVTLR
jgi:hypothetical protein